ncbi:MAG TPA: NAD-dependent malic enzyme, partial [Solirubrobacteraceae bacterium]|nr:NAD-dependent malic enzyme [Solirubrobacteraceae bacterium]
FHDDQHGTAIVVLAAFLNALKVVDKRPEDVKVVLTGVGAAGVAVTKILLAAGVRNIVGCDRHGAIVRDRDDLTPEKAEYAQYTNPNDEHGTADEVLAGADVFLGLSGPGAITVDAVRTMAPDAIVFAMANPVPEVQPEEVRGDVAIMATGRSDYPNQINNVLAFPGVFKGALEVRAKTINEEMKLAAAHAIARVIPDDELHADYIIPSVFNRRVAETVAEEVANAAVASGVARRKRGATGEPTTPLEALR